jgi:hypothetical protein
MLSRGGQGAKGRVVGGGGPMRRRRRLACAREGFGTCFSGKVLYFSQVRSIIDRFWRDRFVRLIDAAGRAYPHLLEGDGGF